MRRRSKTSSTHLVHSSAGHSNWSTRTRWLSDRTFLSRAAASVGLAQPHASHGSHAPSDTAICGCTSCTRHRQQMASSSTGAHHRAVRDQRSPLARAGARHTRATRIGVRRAAAVSALPSPTVHSGAASRSRDPGHRVHVDRWSADRFVGSERCGHACRGARRRPPRVMPGLSGGGSAHMRSGCSRTIE